MTVCVCRWVLSEDWFGPQGQVCETCYQSCILWHAAAHQEPIAHLSWASAVHTHCAHCGPYNRKTTAVTATAGGLGEKHAQADSHFGVRSGNCESNHRVSCSFARELLQEPLSHLHQFLALAADLSLCACVWCCRRAEVDIPAPRWMPFMALH